MERDQFYQDGRRYMEESRADEEEWRDDAREQRRAEESTSGDDIRLLSGKVKRGELKLALREFLVSNE